MMIDFSKSADGLVPVIVQDTETRDVLMLGYMNEEALAMTNETGRVTFYSRSRRRLWTKGETSGNYLEVSSITQDCDADAILIKARPAGPTCHTGAATCFGNREPWPAKFIHDLERTILDRYVQRPAGSYVAGLFDAGVNRIAQKVGEEAVELIIEAKDDDRRRFVGEAADLLFHFLVLLRAKDVEFSDVVGELTSRRGG